MKIALPCVSKLKRCEKRLNIENAVKINFAAEIEVAANLKAVFSFNGTINSRFHIFDNMLWA